MRILIIGGSRFVGLHLTEAARERGHSVTHFNRGLSAPAGIPGVEEIRGDREQAADLALLAGRRWDAVIDTPGYVPEAVAASANALAGAAGTYCFISTLSVYRSLAETGQDEDAPLADVPPAGTPYAGELYGALKAGCEAEVQRVYGERALIIRPGYIVGPHDPTDRFTYWPVRVREAGEVLAPGNPREPIQVIDARDLAAWTIQLLEEGVHGVFNATGPARPLTWHEFLATADVVAGNGARLTWADEAFLLAEHLEQSGELPLWAPSEIAGLHTFSIQRALDAGLQLRPLAETIADTLSWYASRANGPLRAGLSAPREQELLARFHAWSRARNEG